ncbi:DUF3889 domain-containing protein [Paenibacillus turpanensis]|uniref:DUF3889 domain-containing protein n=1 Tax=Paenibacillus turpanensis TaxID=2689078 RepID=UPI001409FC29|nr:DUF3889 domain-containing protein [Paenibacillus turpanensis]
MRIKIVVTSLLTGLLLLMIGWTYASEEEQKGNAKLMAAFLRDRYLWVKMGEDERQISSSPAASDHLKFSDDGKWIAYVSKEADGSESLHAYHLASGKDLTISAKHGWNPQWAPGRAELAYQEGKRLLRVRLDQANRTIEPTLITEGVDQYSWLPDGQGMIISNESRRVGETWTPIELKLLVFGEEPKPLFTLPEMSNEFFAQTLSSFKWSPDGKWMAFIAHPTASWSMDSNTLCLLAADGSRFVCPGQMLAREDWFKWAPVPEPKPQPSENRIGYIEGEGRFEVSNKHFRVDRVPALASPTYTPKGMMDIGFDWLNEHEVVVSRSPELAWEQGPVPRAKPGLYRLRLKDGQAVQLTQPPSGAGDFAPDYIEAEEVLAWVRKSDTAEPDLSVWTAGTDGSDAALWLEHVDTAPVWYEPSGSPNKAKESFGSADEDEPRGEEADNPPRQPALAQRTYAAPEYARWGRLAMEETSKRYNADIVDYQYLGRRLESEAVAVESFRLWLRQPEREFAVLVTIRVDTDDQHQLSVDIKEIE